MEYTGKQILYFDGLCNLCEGTVQFLLKRNCKKNILFASLQSNAGQLMLKHFNLPQDELFSLIFIDDETVYIKSKGALRITKYLNGIWPMLYLLTVIPAFISDAVYNWIAKNRYKWFGKKTECLLPTPELKSRFLE
jgi:predicted DCC family thiol-disulfide oxidoreductase YuxK